VRWTFAPPVLIDEGGKLQRPWFFSFLNDPVPLRRQIRVRMPSFHFYEGEAGAIADYFAQASNQGWPSRYARTMRLALGLEVKDEHSSDTIRSWPEVMTWRAKNGSLSAEEVAKGAGIQPRVLAGIERGSKPEIDAGFNKLLAWGDKQGFRMQVPVNPSYERVERRSPSHLEARERELAGLGNPIALGAAVGIKGPNCYQCHWHQDLPPDQKDSPLSWGPDLVRVHERLREGWVEDWLVSPGLVYPGTSMPANFQGEPPQYQQVYPSSTNAAQIQAVLDWLYNMDKTSPVAQ